MLDDKTHGYLDEVRKFAKKINMDKQLQKELDYLSSYSGNDTRCILMKDFAPYSFTFLMQKEAKDGEYQDWFNGGLVFHGQHDSYGSGGGAPTFATCVTPMNGWSVHT